MLEVLTTVVIIGIVSAMAAPRFMKAFEKMRFSSANRNITSAMRLARSSAITDKEPYGVYFDDAELTVTLFKDVISPELYSFDEGDSVIRVDSMAHDLVCLTSSCDNNTIVFGRSGSAHCGGYGDVYTMFQNDNLLCIYWHQVTPATGRVQSQCYTY